jgi:RimJ/RimL family protein N-acetyltransferase
MIETPNLKLVLESPEDVRARIQGIAYAFGISEVRVVRAHTLPEENASTRVLAKCGFRQVGEMVDPEDGLVWRWEKRRAAA